MPKRKVCLHPGCTKPRSSKGLCKTHYMRKYRNGQCDFTINELRDKALLAKALLDRFQNADPGPKTLKRMKRFLKEKQTMV